MMVIVENCTAFVEFATNLYKGGIRLIYNPILNNNNNNKMYKRNLDS
jgi:hypothetical protein